MDQPIGPRGPQVQRRTSHPGGARRARPGTSTSPVQESDRGWLHCCHRRRCRCRRRPHPAGQVEMAESEEEGGGGVISRNEKKATSILRPRHSIARPDRRHFGADEALTVAVIVDIIVVVFVPDRRCRNNNDNDDDDGITSPARHGAHRQRRPRRMSSRQRPPPPPTTMKADGKVTRGRGLTAAEVGSGIDSRITVAMAAKIIAAVVRPISTLSWSNCSTVWF